MLTDSHLVHPVLGKDNTPGLGGRENWANSLLTIPELGNWAVQPCKSLLFVDSRGVLCCSKLKLAGGVARVLSIPAELKAIFVLVRFVRTLNLA